MAFQSSGFSFQAHWSCTTRLGWSSDQSAESLPLWMAYHAMTADRVASWHLVPMTRCILCWLSMACHPSSTMAYHANPCHGLPTRPESCEATWQCCRNWTLGFPSQWLGSIGPDGCRVDMCKTASCVFNEKTHNCLSNVLCGQCPVKVTVETTITRN